MQFLTTVATLLAVAGSTIANPVPEPATGAVSMMAAGQTWTIQNFKRVCNTADTSCTYTYAVNTNDGSKATACKYPVTASSGASRATYQNVKCGAFTIGSTWSGQFGAGKGFQTLSVVRNQQIIYPAYTDAQLAGGNTVKPDQSYTPQALP